MERFFGWLKSFRTIILRYEKLASTYKALATIASIIIQIVLLSALLVYHTGVILISLVLVGVDFRSIRNRQF